MHLWRRNIVRIERWSRPANFLYTKLLAGGMIALCLSHPLSVSQHGMQLNLPSLRGRLMSSEPYYGGLRRQMVEGVGVMIGRVSFSSFWKWVVLLRDLKKG